MSFRSQFISDYVVRNVQIRGQTSISVQRAILRNYKKIKISYLVIFQPIWEVAKELQDLQTYQESNTKDTDNIFNMIILHLPQTFKTFKQEKKKKGFVLLSLPRKQHGGFFNFNFGLGFFWHRGLPRETDHFM